MPAIGSTTEAGLAQAETDSTMTPRTAMLFILVHVILWTLIPTFVNRNLPLDTIEALAWGHEWRLGYDKHPPLSAWMLEIAAVVGLRTDLAIYFLSQLLIGITFLLVYKLGREWLSQAQAVVATLILEGIWFYTYSSPEFNVNIAQMPFWVGGSFAFWRAIQTRELHWWILLGFCAAMAMLSKYLGGLMLLPMFIYAFWHPERKKIWTSAGPYVAALTCLVLLLPHLWWMINDDFATIRYGMMRAGMATTDAARETPWTHHLLKPLEFLAEQAAILITPIILYLFSKPQRASKVIASNESQSISHEARAFILTMTLGPFIILTAIALLTGANIRSMWTAPMTGTLGILLSIYFPSTLSLQSRRQFLFAVTFVMLALPISYAVSNLLADANPSSGRRTAFPGRQLALDLTRQWHEKFKRPLTIVIGEEWLGGNLGWYSPDRPMLYHSADPKLAPWCSDDDVRKHGAIALWQLPRRKKQATPITEDTFGIDLARRFPNLIMLPPIDPDWDEKAGLHLSAIKVAFIPPTH